MGKTMWLIFIFSSQVAFAQSVAVDITLNPVGDFVAKTSSVKGSVKKVGEEYLAENIVVDLRTLKTGIELRDEHTQKHLDTKAFPEAILTKAVGKNGKGTGKIKIRGIEKEIKGEFKVLSDNKIEAVFPLTLSDFGISDISFKGVGVEDEVKLTVTVPVQK